MTHAAAVTPTVRSPRRRPPEPAAPERAGAAHHPVVVAHAAQRAADIQLRIADAITEFAGSMPFVYIHAIAFGYWMLFVESDPWPKLTLIVSLEAIFLSTFVMIGQNRQAEFQNAKADHDYATQEQELRRNTELTRQIHTLTTDLHGRVLGTRVAQDEPTSPRDLGTQQLMLVGACDQRATALCFGARLSAGASGHGGNRGLSGALADVDARHDVVPA
jgi:uncharacterized membrane protein